MSNLVTKDAFDFRKILFLQRYMIGHKGYIAGGCFKNIFENKEVKDVDIFFEKEEWFHEVNIRYKKDEDYKKIYESKNAICYLDLTTKVRIDLVRSRFMTAENMIRSFDFTVTKFALWTEVTTDRDGETEYNLKASYIDRFFEDLANKRLVIDDEANLPLGTLQRTWRYAKYGYQPCQETKVKLVKLIRDMEDDEIDFSNDFYAGVD